MIMHGPEQEAEMIKYCDNCLWYESHLGICCNGESDRRADYTEAEDCCEQWEEGETDV